MGLSVLLAAAFVMLSGTVLSADWYNSSWGYRQKITIDTNKVSGSGSFTNFPVLITESNVQSALWAHALTNGNDMLFTDADGVTRLPYEIEKYTAASSQMCAWVRLPLLSALSNASFYMYYGNPGASGLQDTTNLWADYRVVWHFAETSGTNYASTTNHMAAVPSGGVTLSATGRIDGAVWFDGIDGKLTAEQTVNGNGTISMWLWYPWADGNSHRGFFDTWYGGCVLLKMSYGDRLDLYVRTGGGTILDTTYFSSMAGQWLYVTVTLNDGNARLYRNGAYRTNGTYSGTPSYSQTWLGIGYDNAFWLGNIDEVRVSTSVRSDNWIATEYNNQNVPLTFAASGGEEPRLYRGAIFKGR